MGYCHHYFLDPTHPEVEEGLARTIQDAKPIIQAAGVPLSADDEGAPDHPPELAEGWLRLNGVGGDSGACLVLTRHPERSEYFIPDWRNRRRFFNCCKTSGRPYDLVVCAVLLRARAHMPTAFRVSSAGDWNVEWRPARALAVRLFGPRVDPPFSLLEEGEDEPDLL